MSTHARRTEHTVDVQKLVGNAIMFDVLKGGYGKSALSLNLADRLAKRGHDVLYLDLDPNGHISHCLGYDDIYQDGMHDYGFVVSDEKYYAKEDLTPDEMIYDTGFGWDFVPSFNDMESFETLVKDTDNGIYLLAEQFLLPLYEQGDYDYFIMDGGGERSKIADSGFVAGRRCMVPLAPGDEAKSALRRTFDRVITPLVNKNIGFEVMAFVPNLLTERIDHNNADRELLERLNKNSSTALPSFARITNEEWNKIDTGEIRKLPGIRRDASIQKAISNGKPVAEYDPECDQIKHFDELARIVENGGVE